MSNKTEQQLAFHLHKMRTRFRRLDVNHDGFVSWEDFQLMGNKLLDYSNMGEERLELTRKAFTFVADSIGLIPGAKIPVKEAAKMASKNMMSMTPEKQMTVLRSGHNALFDALDFDHDGCISPEEFKIYFQVVAPDISEAEITYSFNTIDKNKNGEISREEFLNAAFDFMFGLEETEMSKVFFGRLLP